jgi:hypothetical protein
MPTLTVTEEQLRLIQTALDFYSRVGMGQFGEIKNHPTFETHLRKEFATGNGPLKVGDQTVRGEVVEIDTEGKWIKTKGSWGKGDEIRKWEDIENIEYSTDYEKYHSVRDQVDDVLTQAKRLLYNDPFAVRNGGWGIHHPSVDGSCRDAYDLIQVIRHEFWKNNPDRSNITVDSSITLTNENNKNIKVEL